MCVCGGGGGDRTIGFVGKKEGKKKGFRISSGTHDTVYLPIPACQCVLVPDVATSHQDKMRKAKGDILWQYQEQFGGD